MTDQLAQLVDRSHNFRFLAEPALLLAGDAAAAEVYVESDPDGAMVKARRFSETLAKLLIKRAGINPKNIRDQSGRIRALDQAGVIPQHVRQLFHEIREPGNEAVHGYPRDQQAAAAVVAAIFKLGVWWYETETGTTVTHAYTPITRATSASLHEVLKNVEDQLAQLQARFDEFINQVRDSDVELSAVIQAESATSITGTVEIDELDDATAIAVRTVPLAAGRIEGHARVHTVGSGGLLIGAEVGRGADGGVAG